MVDLKSLTRGELEAYLAELSEPKFRARQVFQWLHRGAEQFDEMTNLSKALREKLKKNCVITVPAVEQKQVSKLDGTIKYLWRLADGNCIESVVMRYKHGNTICVSSEVGVPHGMRLLCLDIGRIGSPSPALGDSGSGDLCTEGIRTAYLEYCADGNR